MSDTQEHIHRWLPGKGEVSVKVERGARGGYSWEVKVVGPVMDDVLDDGREMIATLEQLDKEMRAKFGVGEA